MSPDAEPEPIQLPRFIPELDGLRCYAFLCVLFAHFYFERFPLGWIGVDIFFVLSGFLITRILLSTKAKPGYFKNFYARRFIRVFPLYYLVLVFMFYAWPRISDHPFAAYPTDQHLSFFLYVQNVTQRLLLEETHTPYLGHFWSLAIEEQYYLVWPVMVLLLKPRLLRVILIAILVLSPLARYATYWDPRLDGHWWVGNEFAGRAWGLHNQWWIYKHTLFRLDGIALGSLVALTVHCGWMRLETFKRIGIALSLTVLPLSFFLIFYETFFPITKEPVPPYMVALIYPLVAFGFAGLIIVLMTCRHALLKLFFNNPLVCYVGKISYGLYVFHWPVWLILVTDYGRKGLSSHVLLTVLTFGLASLSWFAFEKPLLRLKSKFE